MVISIHALREEGDKSPIVLNDTVVLISIHALREEGDGCHRTQNRSVRLFLSTPSARRATRVAILHSNPIIISIHALREEGDFPAPCSPDW